MSINIIYLIIITVLLLLSVLIISSRHVSRKLIPKDSPRHSFSAIKTRYQKFLIPVDVDTTNKLLKTTINRKYYLLAHNTLLVLALLLGILMLVASSNSTIKVLFILIISLYLLLFPREKIFGSKTPYQYLLDLYENRRKKSIDFELYRLTLHLKNLAVASNYKEYSSDYILNSLYESAGQIKPVLGKMISLWNLGQLNEAVNLFSDAIGTRTSHEFSVILRKLDDLTTKELVAQIDLLLQIIRKERETSRIIANENRSNLIYFTVIATSVVIMLNFVVIVYYIEAINNIQFYIN